MVYICFWNLGFPFFHAFMHMGKDLPNLGWLSPDYMGRKRGPAAILHAECSRPPCFWPISVGPCIWHFIFLLRFLFDDIVVLGHWLHFHFVLNGEMQVS